jgi:hypothetical protein
MTLSHRRPLVLLSSAALIWMLLFLVRSNLGAGDGLVAEYFANTDWISPAAFSVADTEISVSRMQKRWNGAPPDRFSVRWTGFLAVGRPGLYRFTLTSDDGSALLIDNRLVVDNGGMHSVETRSGTVQLERGSHVVVLQYVQFGAASVLEWSWSRDDGPSSAVPGWVLSRRPTRYATALNARLVDWALWGVAIAAAGFAGWSLRGIVTGDAIRGMAEPLWTALAKQYRDTASLVFSVFIFIVLLFMPWLDGGRESSFYRAVATTVGDVNGTALASLRSLAAFQSRLNQPRTGEDVLPRSVREMLAMLRSHDVNRYRISDAISADSWVFQQIVASAWPRKLDPDSNAGFILNSEQPASGCRLVDRQTEVSLVYCP